MDIGKRNILWGWPYVNFQNLKDVIAAAQLETNGELNGKKCRLPAIFLRLTKKLVMPSFLGPDSFRMVGQVDVTLSKNSCGAVQQ